MRNINLLPLDYRPAPKFVFKRVIVLLFISILSISIFGGYISLKISINHNNKLISGREQSNLILENNLLANQENSNNLESIRDIVLIIEEIKSSSTQKSSILLELQKHIPTDIKLTNLTIFPEGIIFSCKASSLKSVSELLSSLNTWNRYNGFTIPQITNNDDFYVFQVQGHLKGVTTNE